MKFQPPTNGSQKELIARPLGLIRSYSSDCFCGA
jgi:hypothetical protein